MSICTALLSLLKALCFASSNGKIITIYYHKFLTDKYLIMFGDNYKKCQQGPLYVLEKD